jgi:hypothetical protein
MPPTKQNESVVWKHFLKKDVFIVKSRYCKIEVRSSGNTMNFAVHLGKCKFSPSLKESLTKKNNQLEWPNKASNSNNTDNGDRNVEVEFKDYCEIVSIT